MFVHLSPNFSVSNFFYLKISFTSHQLRFRFPFRIAHGVRSHTDVVLVCAQHEGVCGFGEATLPPYLPDTIESVTAFLTNKEVQEITFPFSTVKIFDQLDKIIEGNMPAKAALDMALWQLKAKLENKSLSEVFGIETQNKRPHSYTIGIGTRDEMREKIQFAEAEGFDFFKLKMDGEGDENVLNDFLALSSKPFAVDANQGWNDLQHTINFSAQLEKSGCMLIEQPFEKTDRRKSAELLQTLSIPLIADEACQRLSDIESIMGAFSGINIKLQKCGGLTEAVRMIEHAKSLGLKTLIGCMSESSIGCGAAEAIAPLCNWADLDGPWLIENDEEIQMLTVAKGPTGFVV